MLLPSQHRELTESYKQLYLGQVDYITDVMIEELVEELVEECVEFGYTLDESVVAVEEAATEYLMEINPYAPAGSKGARDYQKSTNSTKRGAERTAAVKGAIDNVKSKVSGVKAAAGIAGSIAKDEVGRAGRNATHAVGKSANAVGRAGRSAVNAAANAASKSTNAVGSAVKGAAGAVSTAFSNKKAEVKQGVKSLLGRGLRKVAGAVGNVAQRASGAASRLGEEYTAYDIILEHLVAEGYADTNKSALVIMANMGEEWRENILDESGLSQDTIQSAVIKRQKRNDAELAKNTPAGDAAYEKGRQKVKRSKSHLNINNPATTVRPSYSTSAATRALNNSYEPDLVEADSLADMAARRAARLRAQAKREGVRPDGKPFGHNYAEPITDYAAADAKWARPKPKT